MNTQGSVDVGEAGPERARKLCREQKGLRARAGAPYGQVMSDTEHLESLRAAERRLQAAQHASDVEALSELLDDALLFTAPDGSLHTKDDDLRVHRSGHQEVSALEESDLRALVTGSTGVTWFLGTLAGSIGGKPFSARMRYTRTWTRDPGAGSTDQQSGPGARSTAHPQAGSSDPHGHWRLVAAHATIIE